MSNPFVWFRKKQKILMGISAVALMFVFTISLGTGVDPLIDFFSGNWNRGSGDGQVVVQWNGGDLRERQLEHLRTNRRLVGEFLRRADYLARERGGRPQDVLLGQGVSDEAIVEIELLQSEARTLGIQVSDDDVKSYLLGLTDDRVKLSEFSNLWQSLTGKRYSDQQLFELLRRELAAQRIRELIQIAAIPTSPVQDWDLFNRLEREVSIELMPLAIQDFVDQVPEPSEADIRTFFETYQDVYPDPNRASPGFRRRERRAFEFVKFDFDAFMALEKDQITNAEVQEYYDKNKDEFLAPDLPESDLKLDDSPAGESTTQDKAPDTAAEAIPGAESTTTPESTAPVEPAGPPESPAPQDSTTAPQSPAPPESPVPPAAETPNTEAPDTDEPPSSQPESSLSPLPQEEAPQTEPTEAPSADPAAPETPESEVAAPEASDSEAAAPEAAADGKELPEDQGGSSDGQAVPDGTAETNSPARYLPIEKVADEIRRRIALPRAQARISAAINATRSQLNRQLQPLADQARQGKAMESSHPVIDLSEISRAPKLTVESVPRVDEVEIMGHEIGKAVDSQITPAGMQVVPFAMSAFAPNLSKYSVTEFPAESSVLQQYLPFIPQRFLFWMTDLQPGYVPSLEEVRDEVVLAWKKSQALKLALEEAQRDAEKARTSGKPLAEALASDQRTNFIGPVKAHWLTTGSIPAAGGAVPRPSEIPGVEGTTEEMRRAIFLLSPGEVTTVVNGPQTNVYVVRLMEDLPSADVRRGTFLRDRQWQEGVVYLKYVQREEQVRAWYLDLLRRKNVVWLREPNIGPRDEMG